jgi:hypothetical protein
VGALANPQVGKFINEHFVSSFQRVGTFRIVGKQKQGGNVAAYFCAPDGRVLHCVAGPVNAAVMLKEAKWVIDTTEKVLKECENDGGKFKMLFRKAHAEKLRVENGLVVEPVLFDDFEEQDPNSPLQYRDPSGRPIAPKLPPPPIDGPDVKLMHLQEAMAKANAGVAVADRKGKGWRLNTQGQVHALLAAHCMVKIENVYGAVFQGILGEQISTRPVEVVDPFPGRFNADPKLKKKLSPQLTK